MGYKTYGIVWIQDDYYSFDDNGVMETNIEKMIITLVMMERHFVILGNSFQMGNIDIMIILVSIIGDTMIFRI